MQKCKKINAIKHHIKRHTFFIFTKRIKMGTSYPMIKVRTIGVSLLGSGVENLIVYQLFS